MHDENKRLFCAAMLVMCVGYAAVLVTDLYDDLAHSTERDVMPLINAPSAMLEVSGSGAYERGYERGVNHALDAIMLLHLEQTLIDTNRAWGAMADIVREHLRVSTDKEGGEE